MFSDLFLFSMEHICLHHLRLGLIYSTIYWFWWYFLPTFYNCIFQLKTKFFSFSGHRNWVFATKKNFLIPVFFQPDGVNLRYFKLSTFDLTQCIVWNFTTSTICIRLHKYWDYKIRVCGKNSVPFCHKTVEEDKL